MIVDWINGDGTFALSASTSSLAARTFALDGVSVGMVMYLCLKYNNSEPWMPPVDGMYV